METQITPITWLDIIQLVEIDGEQANAYTEVKMMGDLSDQDPNPDSRRANARGVEALRDPMSLWMKATDAVTGEILGVTVTKFINFKEEDVPNKNRFAEELDLGATDSPPIDYDTPDPTALIDHGPVDLTEDKKRAIARVMRMEKWQRTQCRRWDTQNEGLPLPAIKIAVLEVLPEHRRKGVGAKMMQWVKDVAAPKKAQIWLHSKPEALPFYQVCGFTARGTFDIDLDYWAPEKRADGQPRGKYTITKMLWTGAS